MYYLRELTKTDIPVINKWHNDKEIIDNLCSVFRYINIETDEAWFDNYQKNRNNQIRLTICLEKNNLIIGAAYIINIDYINSQAQYGGLILAEEEYRNQGLGKKITNDLINHVFLNLNLNRFYGYWLEENNASVKMGENCGFKKEGLLKEAIFKNGKYNNILIMSILKSEYLKNNSI